jgi:hypothetical protein
VSSEGIEPVTPELVERGANLGEAAQIDLVQPALRVDARRHEPGLAQQLQVRARRRPRQPGNCSEFGSRSFAVTREAEHRAPSGMAHRPDGIVE